MILNISKRKRIILLASPFVVVFLGFITATIFSTSLNGWAWVPLTIVYWSSLGLCIYCFKGEKTINEWLKKSSPSTLMKALSLLLGMFPLSILIMNYKLFDSLLLIVLWIMFALINPWFEELYWRGLLLDAFMDWFPKWIGVTFTTILFVLSHPLMWGVFSIASTSPHLYIYLTIMGIIWSITYFKTKSLRWVILSHFIVDIGNITVLTFLNIYVPH